MKGYIKRILTIALIIVVFVVSFNIKLDNSLGKTFRTIANSNKSADTCTTGAGTVYYVKNNISALNIRDTNSTSGNAIGTLSQCTEVVVYCTNSGWGKISKVSNKWVSLSYLSISAPTGCTYFPSTTTDKITFGSVERKYKAYGTSENDVNQMYRDKPGTIEMTVKNITYMASDEQNKINVKITKNNVDVTSDFIIARSGIDTDKMQIVFNFTMKPNTVYDEGQYKVTFSYSSASTTGTFDLVGRYYHFTLNVEKTKGYSKNYINKQNIWHVNLKNLEPADIASTDADTKNNFKLMVLDANGKDASSHFKITYKAGYIEVENERTAKKPSPGKYQMFVKYINTSYTTARSEYNQTYDFVMDGRSIDFDEKSDLRTSYRYDRFDIKEDYQIKVIRKSGSSFVIKERKSDGSYSNEMTISSENFADTYRDFNPLDVVYYNNRPVITFETVSITRFINNQYTYIVDGVTKTGTLETLETLYPGITDTINQVDINGIKKYTFDSDGYVEYNAQGSKTIHQQSLQIVNKPILSSSGGIMNFVIEHKGLNSEDASVMPVITRADGVVMTESNGFKIISQQYEDIDNENGGKMYLTIEYDNTDSINYTNSYKVSYTFKDLEEKPTFAFTLSDGDIDYYLMSSYDGHLTDPFDAINTIPPGNKRYEYYLGFYLMKTGGTLLNYKPSNEMTYRVFTEQVDCDNNSSVEACESSMYYFKQIDYTLSIVRYFNDQITFDVTFDTQANNKRYTLSVEEFKEKYYEVWDLFKYYTFDESGYLNGNNYALQVKKIYNGEENQAYVDFIPAGETEIITKTIKEFSSLYPEYYVYVTNHYSTDANDNVVNGRLRGSYRIREENGVAISGQEITDQFDFTIDMDPYNVDRAITVFPVTEVNAGTYYVYVGFEGRMGVGYTNNYSDPVITREQYPEMWNRSIHMTTITYDTPVYDIEIKDPEYLYNQTISDTLYANISNRGVFDITTKYIYDYSGFSYHIERKDGSNWINADNLFSTTSIFSESGSSITINTIPEKTVGGDYRIVVEYNHEGFTLKEERTYEFKINEKYYGLAFVENPNADVTFIKNYTQTKEFDALGYYVTDIDNVQFQLVRRIDEDTVREFTWDKENKQFIYNGKVLFKYEVLANQINTGLLDYLVRLTNVRDLVEEGNYELTISYGEDGNKVVSSTIKFDVGAEQYRFAIGNEETAIINREGYSIRRNVYTSFINYEDLDFIDYVIYYHVGGGEYVDVSSVDSSRRMFVISDNFSQDRFDQKYNGIEYEYKGLLNIAINEDLVDFNGQYYINMRYDKKDEDFIFSSPGELFDWSSELKVTAQFNNNGEKIPVENFYLNVDDVTLTVDIDTPHEDIANYIITSSCLNGSCVPTQELNLNNRFNYIASESSAEKIVLKYRKDLEDNEKLAKGTYALVIYYNNNDFEINTFDVVTEYAEIKLDDVVQYSDISSTRTEPNLFKNKVGHIEIPVSVFGVSYVNTTVSITRNGTGDYSNAFTYNRSKYENEHILELTYNPRSGIEAGDYSIMVSYVNADGVTISDNVIVTINQSFFSFELGNPIYNPNPPIANADPYGEVIFDVATEEIANISIPSDGDDASTEKHKFANRTIITNANNVDVTSMFEVSARISTTSPANFNLVLKYTKNSVVPGAYSVKVSYASNGYLATRNAYFEISDYEKDITISNMEILTTTNDKRIHNNVGGVFKINYRSLYDISVDDIAVNVMNSNNTLVTDNFKIVKSSRYINVELIPKSPALASGEYTINIIYTDPNTGKVKNHSLPINIYGTYKEITISNMECSTSKVYADLSDQYYTFDLNTSNLSDQEIENMDVRVYDKYGNIVYSSIASDNVSNIFDIVNEVKTNGYFVINILEFKSPVGEYEVELLSLNEENDYNVSNRLSFSVDATAYRLRLSIDSKIVPSNIYNNDADAFYDADYAKVDYSFTSNYATDDTSYSIKVIKNGVVVQEITELNLSRFTEFGVNYLNSKIDVYNLDVGVYDIAICLKGLPYEAKTIEVFEYIPVTSVTLTNKGEIIDDTISTNVGRSEQIVTYIEPRNATNKVLEFTSSDESIFTINDGVITPIGEGSAKLIVKHHDYNKEFTVEVSNKISSDIYDIDYEAKTIFVNALKGDRLAMRTLVTNINDLSNEYQVRNSSGEIITDVNGLVGTKSTLISGGDTYTIILIGDIDGNGIVNLADANYIFRIYRGSYQTDEYTSVAARVNKGTSITMYDVNKVFRLYRGVINEI